MSDAGTTQAITWLRTGKAPKERAPEVVGGVLLLRGTLPATAESLHRYALGADVEAALLQVAEEDGRWELVGLIAGHAGHKANQKAAKKAAFRARARGVELPDAEAAGRRAVAVAATPDPPPSFCTGSLGDGSLVAVLGCWSAEDGPSSLLGVLGVNDTLLIMQYAPHQTLARLRQALGQIAHDRGVYAEVPSDVAAGLLRRGYERAQRNRQSIEGDVSRGRRLIEGVPALDALELRDAPADRLDELCAGASRWATHPVLAGWIRAIWSFGVPPTMPAAERRQAIDAMADDTRQLLALRLEVATLLLPQAADAEARAAVAATAIALRDARRAPTSLALVARAIRIDHIEATPS